MDIVWQEQDIQQLVRHEPASIRKLVASIESDGLKQPIMVRRLPDGNYAMIAGYARLLAVELAGQDTILAVISDMTEMEAIRYQFHASMMSL